MRKRIVQIVTLFGILCAKTSSFSSFGRFYRRFAISGVVLNDIKAADITNNLESLRTTKILESSERKTPPLYHWKAVTKAIGMSLIGITLFCGGPSRADDELAKYAADGNTVGVDGECFVKKCSLESVKCASDQNCIKGLACLGKCKGGSMCSTGCFAKYGSDKLDGLLACSVEKNDCVHVPRLEVAGWKDDLARELPTEPIKPFNPASLDGTWYKVMGLVQNFHP